MINKNYTHRTWEDVQAETLDFIHRLINMIQIYDREKKFPHLHDYITTFQKKFVKGNMQVHEMGGYLGMFSDMLSASLKNHSFERQFLAENVYQPPITEGMKKYFARNCFGHLWEFYFKNEENAQKAFMNLTETNFRLCDDVDTKCDELTIPPIWWADGEMEPIG